MEKAPMVLLRTNQAASAILCNIDPHLLVI